MQTKFFANLKFQQLFKKVLVNAVLLQFRFKILNNQVLILAAKLF